jgi:hypothetical protein
MANGCANETVWDGGTTREAGDIYRGLSPGQRDEAERRRRWERWETCVVWLITQRSRVQIPHPLPGKMARKHCFRGHFLLFVTKLLVTRASDRWVLGPEVSPARQRSCWRGPRVVSGHLAAVAEPLRSPGSGGPRRVLKPISPVGGVQCPV